MLVLNGKDVIKVLKIRETMKALEEAFREYCKGLVRNPNRTVIEVNENDYMLYMPSYVEKRKALAIKIVSAYTSNTKRNLPTVMAAVVLNDPDTGEPLALIEGSSLTAIRTGAVGGIAAKYLSRNDSRVVAIIGAGRQARTQLMAITEVRKLERVVVFDPNPDRVRTYLRYVEDMGIDGEAARSAEEAVRDADIVILATTSKEPVIRGKWIRKGTHVTSIGWVGKDSREIDSETVRIAKVVVESQRVLEESGDIRIPIEKGVIDKDHVHGELCEVVTGKKPGREKHNEITLFKSVGLAMEDAVVARLAYERAVEMGLGINVELH